MPTVLYSSADVAVDQLEFDPQNPRLVGQVDAHDTAAVLRFMLDDAALVDLASSISAQGFFPGEPVLCCPQPELSLDTKPTMPTETDRYIVVEGNRRLAAVVLLRNPTEAPARKRAIEELAANGSPDRLPVIIFPRRDDILDYLGYRHITGIKEWDPLAKARYLSQVRDRKKSAGDPSDTKALARLIGSNAPYVGRLLTALAAWDRLEELGFFNDHNLTADDLPFAVFSTSLNYETIPDWLSVDPTDDATVADISDENLFRLAKWFFVPDERVTQKGTLLRESRNIRYINEIVGNDEAMDALDEDAISPQAAASLTAEPSKVFSEAVNESGRYMSVAVRRFDAVERPDANDSDTLGTIRDQAEELRGRITDRLAES